MGCHCSFLQGLFSFSAKALTYARHLHSAVAGARATRTLRGEEPESSLRCHASPANSTKDGTVVVWDVASGAATRELSPALGFPT